MHLIEVVSEIEWINCREIDFWERESEGLKFGGLGFWNGGERNGSESKIEDAIDDDVLL